MAKALTGSLGPSEVGRLEGPEDVGVCLRRLIGVTQRSAVWSFVRGRPLAGEPAGSVGGSQSRVRSRYQGCVCAGALGIPT